MGWLSILISFAGIWFIYKNKENNGYAHLKTYHGWCGAAVMVSTVGLGLAGGIFLHPDFGVDKTNKTIRKAHKLASRATLALAWLTAIGGINQLTDDTFMVLMYALPLLALIPFVLI